MLRSSEIEIPRRYPIITLAIFFLASIGIWVFCFIVDPYDLYPEVPGLSQERSVDLFYFLRLHKPYAVERIHPQVLIVGSSRAAGLPPQPLERLGSPAYNAALPGATLREIRQMVEHAQAITPIKYLLVTLDHPMFRQGNSDLMIYNEANRYLKVDPSLRDRLRHLYQRIVDLWRSLYSVDAVMDSWRALFGSDRSERITQKDGTWDTNMGVAPSPVRLYSTLCMQYYDSEIAGKSSPFAFDELTELLDYADKSRIRVTLLIAPMQGLLMQTVYLAGTWESYLNWQRDLVTLVDARNSDTKIFGLEDNPQFILEALEAPDPLFRDGLHYTHKAGAQITTCLAGPCESPLNPTLLDNHSIDSYLERVDALRTQYVRENPADIAKLRKWLQLQPSDGT